MKKLNPSVLSPSLLLSSSSKTLSVPCSLLARNQTLLNKNQTKVSEFNISKNNLEGTFGVQEQDVHLSLLGNPNLCSPTLKPLHPCSKPKQPLSYVVLAMLVVWVVILLESLVLWCYKTKEKKCKVIAFH